MDCSRRVFPIVTIVTIVTIVRDCVTVLIPGTGGIRSGHCEWLKRAVDFFRRAAMVDRFTGHVETVNGSIPQEIS